jgi:hypothetical protein
MKHRKVSVSWQNDTVELSRKEQVVISRLRTEYTRPPTYCRIWHTHSDFDNFADTPLLPACASYEFFQCMILLKIYINVTIAYKL